MKSRKAYCASGVVSEMMQLVGGTDWYVVAEGYCIMTHVFQRTGSRICLSFRLLKSCSTNARLRQYTV